MAKEQLKENDVLDDEDVDEDEHAEGSEGSEGEADGDDDAEGEDGGADSEAEPEPEIDPELEAKRKRRADEKRAKRQREREARERRDRELAQSRQEIAELKRQNEDFAAWRAQNESVAIDQRLAHFHSSYDQANAAYAEAISKGDGRGAVHWDRLRQEFASKYHEAAGLKQRVSQRVQQPTPQAFDPSQQRAQSLAREWAARNTWWDPNGGDEDSVIVNAIDAKLAQDGYKPDTPTYWDELQKRVERRLPDHARARGRGGPPMSGSRDGTSGGATPRFPRQVTDAWREAGLYDEPAKLKRVQDAYLRSMKQSSR